MFAKMQLASVPVRLGLLLLLGSCVAIVNETEAQLKARLIVIGGYISTSTSPSTAAAQSSLCGSVRDERSGRESGECLTDSRVANVQLNPAPLTLSPV